MYILVLLKFTPLEFETMDITISHFSIHLLKFTPLEFETFEKAKKLLFKKVKIYSVGV